MADIQVFNPDGVAGTIPAEQLDQALKAGYSLANDTGAPLMPASPVPDAVKDLVKPVDVEQGTGRYNVVAPTGEKGTVSAEQLQDALGKGYKLQSAADTEAAHRSNIDQWKQIYKSILPESAYVALSHAGNFFGAAQGAIDLVSKYGFHLDPNDIEDSHTALQELSQENPIAAAGGELARFAGEAYIGGKLAGGAMGATEGLTSKIANPIVQAAVKEGIGGAAVAAPQALAQIVIDKDPAAAAESMLIGIGTGAVIGSGLKSLSGGLEATATASERAAATVKQPLSTQEKLLLDKLGLTTRMRTVIGEAEDQRAILRTLANEFGEKQLASMDREELANKVKSLIDDNGPRIGAHTRALDALAEERGLPKIKTNDMAAKIAAIRESLVGDDEKAVADSAIKQLQEQNPEMTFQEAEKIKRYFQGKTNYNMIDDSNINRVKKAVAAAIRGEIESAADRVATEAGTPQLLAERAKLKQLYGVGKTLEAGADRVLNAPVTHELIPGGHGTLGAGYLGHVVGSAMGVPIVGPILGVVGSKLLKNYLREGGLTKAGYWLGARIKQGAGSEIHSFVAVDAIRSIGQRLEDIPQFVKSLAEMGAVRSLSPVNEIVNSSIRDALGDEANGLSKEQQFSRLAQKITFMASNPQAQHQHFGELVEGLADQHPQLASDLTTAMQKKLEYLFNILPKNPNSPQPFMHDADWKPTAAQLATFKKQLAVANDPFHVLEELKAGTLSPQQVATLSVINPDLLSKLRNEVIRVSMDKKASLDYQKRLTMSILLGEKIDKGLMSLPPNIGQPQAPQGPPPGKGKGQPKKPTIKPDQLPDYRTTFQKSLAQKD